MIASSEGSRPLAIGKAEFCRLIRDNGFHLGQSPVLRSLRFAALRPYWRKLGVGLDGENCSRAEYFEGE